MSVHESLVASARHWAAECPDKTVYAFLRDGELVEDSLTYAELDRRARGLASLMQRRHGAGERVLLLFPSGVDFVVAFVACLYAGLVPVPVNNPRPKQIHWQRLETIVTDAGVALVLTTADNLARNSSWLQDSPVFGAIPRLAIDACALPGPEQWVEPYIERDAVAFLQYTSGSTGAPKGVMVSHGNLIHNLELIRTSFGHDPSSVLVTWLPLFHDLGLIGNVLQTLYVGATCYLMTPVAFLQQPSRWLRAISNFRATSSMAPNFAYERCLDIPDEQKAHLDLSHWRLALNGAEPIRLDTIEAFEHAFVSCGFRPEATFPAYGLAEGTLISAVADTLRPVSSVIAEADALRAGRIVRVSEHRPPETVRLVASGRACAGSELLAVDPDAGARRDDGFVGEIWIRSDSVCRGYWQKPEATRDVFEARLDDGSGPFLRTGDLGFLLDGEVYITGRLKEAVIIRGQNHYPTDLEQAAQQGNAALRADCGAAFGVDDGGEERLVIVQEVERTALRDLDESALFGAIRRAVAEATDVHVHAIVLLRPATLPKTSSGKIQRRLCRQIFESGERFDGELARDVIARTGAATDDAEPSRLPAGIDIDGIRGLVVARLARSLGVTADRLDDGATFSDLGLDSSVAVGFASDVERWVGRPQDPSLLWIHPTIDGLCEHMLAELRQAPDVAEIR